jgi:4-amino-4-deoxychorismate lyase
MFQFIETIRVEQGQLKKCEVHQKRLDDTLSHFGVNPFASLHDIQCPEAYSSLDLVKCRVLYDFTQLLQIDFTPYSIKQISTVSLVDIGDRDYSFKSADRQWITDLLNISGASEIIMHDNGTVKDASYANLVFYDGSRWITPATPLLQGTKRDILLANNIIYKEPILVDQLTNFTKIKFINAMMNWEESPVLDISTLSLK